MQKIKKKKTPPYFLITHLAAMPSQVILSYVVYTSPHRCLACTDLQRVIAPSCDLLVELIQELCAVYSIKFVNGNSRNCLIVNEEGRYENYLKRILTFQYSPQF